MSAPTRRAQACRHFAGFQHDECKIGVNYDEVRVPKVDQDEHYRIACLRSDGKRWCEKYNPLTDAEREAEEIVAKESTSLVLKAMWAIAEQKQQSGSISCPKCAGVLRYSKAPGNGHIRAKCETPDCIAFMQ